MIPLHFIDDNFGGKLPVAGDCWWMVESPNGNITALQVVLPGSFRGAWTIRVKQEGNRGGVDAEGPWHTWDGSISQPTLRGSIQAGDWHGFICNGFIYDKAPPDC